MKLIYQIDSAGRKSYYKVSASGEKTKVSKNELSAVQLRNARLSKAGSASRSKSSSKSGSRSRSNKRRSTKKSAKRSTKKSAKRSTKRSTKRKSATRKTVVRRKTSPRRSPVRSPRRSPSPKRRSPARSSPRRNSPRSSPRRSTSPARTRANSPVKDNKIMKEDLQVIVKEITENVAEKTKEDVQNGNINTISEDGINEVATVNAVTETDKVLETRSVPWLRNFAQKLKIKGYETMTHPQLLAAIKYVIIPLISVGAAGYVYEWITPYYPALAVLAKPYIGYLFNSLSGWFGTNAEVPAQMTEPVLAGEQPRFINGEYNLERRY